MLGFNGGLLGKKRKQETTTPGLWFPNERAIIAGSDPYWDNVVLYLPMTGVDASTTFTDLSTTSCTTAAVGNAQVSTTRWPFAGSGSSGLFDGTGDYINVSYNDALDLHAGSFTIECWIYRTAGGVTQQIISNYGSETTGYGLGLNSSNKLVANLSGDVNDITGTTTVPANQWCHVALSGKPLSSVKMFLDGTQEGSTFTGATSLNSGGIRTAVGAFWWYSDSNIYDGFNGNISHLRITTKQRYASNFTPPTAPFPNA